MTLTWSQLPSMATQVHDLDMVTFTINGHPSSWLWHILGHLHGHSLHHSDHPSSWPWHGHSHHQWLPRFMTLTCTWSPSLSQSPSHPLTQDLLLVFNAAYLSYKDAILFWKKGSSTNFCKLASNRHKKTKQNHIMLPYLHIQIDCFLLNKSFTPYRSPPNQLYFLF